MQDYPIKNFRIEKEWVFIENEGFNGMKKYQIPRKIIMDFINACNSFNEAGTFEDLDAKLVYERRLNGKMISGTDGL